jgi:hypothetical protein
MVDLLPVLGTCRSPSVLVDARWMGPDEGRLAFASHACRQAVATARRIVAVPFTHDGGWGEVRHVRRAIQSETRDQAVVITFGTATAFRPGTIADSIPIACLCSPGTP